MPLSPRLIVELRESPRFLTWGACPAPEQLPGEWKEKIREMRPDLENPKIWVDLLLESKRSGEKCPRCSKGEPVATLNLCLSCFERLTREFFRLGLLEFAPDEMLRGTTLAKRVFSRVGLYRQWILAEGFWIVKPGKESAFMGALNELIGFKGHERLTVGDIRFDLTARNSSGSSSS